MLQYDVKSRSDALEFAKKFIENVGVELEIPSGRAAHLL